METPEMTTVSVIKLFTPTKEGIQSFVNRTIDLVKGGEINPLELKLYLKTMEKIIEGIDAGIKESARDEAEKYGERKFAFHGAEIELANTYTKYDYSQCGDPELNEAEKEIKLLSEVKKQREKFLQTITNSLTITNQETGECFDINPPAKMVTKGIKITIK